MANLGGMTPIGKHIKEHPRAEALFEDVGKEDVADVFKVWQANPVLAAADIFGFKYGLPGHQSLALKLAWTVGDCIQVWSRGAGKTFFLSMFAWLSAILYPEEKIGIFGPSFRQSKFVWAEIERSYDKSPVIRELCTKRPIITPDKCHTKLYNGSLIEALPLGDGSKIRGARYYRILCDEAAQVPEDILDIVIQGMRATTKDPMEAVMALKLQKEMLDAGQIGDDEILFKPEKNKMLLTSTAFYQFNHLYRRVALYRKEISSPINSNLNPVIHVPDYVMWNNERALIMFDYQDPPEGFMNIESIMEAKKKMSDLKWRMEYCAYFPPDSEGFYKLSKIETSRSHRSFTIETKGKPQYNYVAGIDVARNSDNFAIAIGRVVGDKVELVCVLTLNSREFTEMHDKIREVLDRFKIIYMCMDAGGGGTSLEDLLHDERMCPKHQKLIWDSVNNEEFQEKEGWHVLEMIKFSDDSIPKMAYQLQADIDHGRFLFPSRPSYMTQIAETGYDADNNSLEVLEDAYSEIDSAIHETTSIVAQSTRTGKIHLGLPGEISKAHQSEDAALLAPPRKDRWTAIMLMNWAAHRKLRQIEVEKEEEPELVTGMSMAKGIMTYSSIPTHVAIRMMKRK